MKVTGADGLDEAGPDVEQQETKWNTKKRQDAAGWFWEGNIIFFSLTSTVERVLGDFVVCMLFLFARGCSIPFSRRVSVRVRARAD